MSTASDHHPITAELKKPLFSLILKDDQYRQAVSFLKQDIIEVQSYIYILLLTDTAVLMKVKINLSMLICFERKKGRTTHNTWTKATTRHWISSKYAQKCVSRAGVAQNILSVILVSADHIENPAWLSFGCRTQHQLGPSMFHHYTWIIKCSLS